MFVLIDKLIRRVSITAIIILLSLEGREFLNSGIRLLPYVFWAPVHINFILTNSQNVTFYVRLSLCVNKNLKIIKKYENN